MQKLIVSFLSLTVLFTLALTANAQGRYRGRTYSKADVDRIIHRVEDSTDTLRKAVDKNLDRSRLDGTRREDDINEQVKQLENALDELRNEFDRHDTWRESRRAVEKVMRQSDEVNAIFRRLRFHAAVEAQWRNVRADLNRLAGIYNLPLLRV
jgi:DNA repair exonuclease SbcCD ATPase subunit